jgi:sugar phosphate isomerase/epimerase
MIGLFSWYGYPRPFAERMVKLKKAGFDVTALWLGIEEEMVRSFREGSMVSIARGEGLAIDNVHAPYAACNRLWSESGRVREVVVREYRRCLDFCAEHGIPTLVVHVTQGLSVPAPNHFGLRALESVLRTSEDTGVRLAIENTRHSAHIDYILGNLEIPQAGFCYDVSHDFLYCAEPGALLVRWGHRLAAVHLSDTDGKSDCHWLPCLGMVAWEMLLNSFPALYPGHLILEVLPKDANAEGEDDFVQRAHDAAVRLDAMLGSKA